MTSTIPVSLRSGRPLAAMQRPLWMSQRSHPESPMQNMALLTHIRGEVDPQRLADAFTLVVQTSDVLRTRIEENDGVASVHLDAEPQPLEVVDIARAQAEAWATDRVMTPIDVSVRGWDSVMLRHDDGTLSWYLALHHIITDATASSLVFAATAAAYRGEVIKLDPYYPWARAQTNAKQTTTDTSSPRVRRAAAYWKDRAPQQPVGRLYQPISQPTPEAARLQLPLQGPLAELAEQRLASDYKMLSRDLAWSTLLVSATAVYLHRVAGSGSLSIGLPVHNRSDPKARSLFGPVMEVFPVDVEILPGQTFRDLHRQVAKSVLRTLANSLPGLAPTGDYEAVVNVIPRGEVGSFGSLGTSTRWIHPGSIDAAHLLRVQLTAYEAGSSDPNGNQDTKPQAYELALDINQGAADPGQMERAPGHFLAVLTAMLQDPDQSMVQPVCSQGELRLIQDWETTPSLSSQFSKTSQPATDQPAPAPPIESPPSSTWDQTSLVGLLRSTLRDSRAIVLSEQTVPGSHSGLRQTGAAVWEQVTLTAAWLGAQGVGPGTRVGIKMGRRAETVVAILATLVAGGSFVPLDPAQPEGRITGLAQRANCLLVLTGLPPLADLRGAQLSESAVTPGRSESIPGPDDEAYLLFTSGSTGEPKGVAINHRGLTNYLHFALNSYLGNPRNNGAGRPVVPLFSALSFDLTITSLFLPLIGGGELLVITEDGPAGLAAIAKATQITWCKATPSHLEILLRLLPADHRLRTVVVGGEAFGSGLARRLLQFNPQLTIFNEYGPTEAVVGCMIHQVDPDRLGDHEEVPIGRPAPGVTLRVVGVQPQSDPANQNQVKASGSELTRPRSERVPIGSVGELYIAHPGLTSGYLDSEGAETSNSFIVLDGQRFYRSGDLVRMAEPDSLVFLGRIDQQVKVGGIRLEPTEVEEALISHPAIARAVVSLWSPTATEVESRCQRCGLATNVPGVLLDANGICGTCHDYDRVAPQTQSWFRTLDDLKAKRDEARSMRTGQYDCLHLLSGGKDSTYALYQLVELGFRPYALTLDNGYISEGALENVRRSIADLGIDHEFATTDSMNEIFRDSLERHSNVCHGCYKTIYTLATNRAVELGIPMIITGLSRGQLFETRLIPQQFAPGHFDPDAIDRSVVEARKIYHRLNDGPNRLLNNDVFQTDEVFDQIEYVDFFRYIDVELSDLFAYLDAQAPWVRPADTGRSTNCLINAAGIHTHLTEQGFHNYALPYAWDVRLGHKTRQEAIEELDDQLDLDDVSRLLSELDYRPRAPQILTAWIQLADGWSQHPTPAELRVFLSATLPRYAIPAAFVVVDQFPLTTNGKLDSAALPAPDRIHRSGAALQVAPETELERTIVGIWERVLRTEPIGTDDDFFALGGDSLAALEMMVGLSDAIGEDLGDDLAFHHTTPRALAGAIGIGIDIDELGPGGRTDPGSESSTGWTVKNPPPLSEAELAILFEQSRQPDSTLYNIARLFSVQGPIDGKAVETALQHIAANHVPLSWSYGANRRPLASRASVSVDRPTQSITEDDLALKVSQIHRSPFNLDTGPLLRCLVQPMDDGTTSIVLACHHVCGDAESFNQIWIQLDRALQDQPIQAPAEDYPTFTQRQLAALTETDRLYWVSGPDQPIPARLTLPTPQDIVPDGFLSMVATITPGQLRALSGSTGFTASLAALTATLRRYSNGNHIEVGVITSTRDQVTSPDEAGMIGYFLNTLPVILDCDPAQTSRSLVGQAGAAAVQNLAHRSYPYARIVANRRQSVEGSASNQQPGPTTQKAANQSLVSVLLAYDELDQLTLAGYPVQYRVLSNGNAVAPATFFVEVHQNRIVLSLEYRGSVMSQPMAQQVLVDFDTMLGAIVSSDIPLGDVALPSSESAILTGPVSRQQSAELREGRPSPSPSPKSAGGPARPQPASLLPQILHHMVDKPHRPAVVCANKTISWGELGRYSGQLATQLSEAGVSPGDQVLICLPRSTDLIAAILAVLRVGAAYVPIDPSYPADRIQLIAEQASAAVALVGSDTGSSTTSSSTSDLAANNLAALNLVVDLESSSSPGQTAQPFSDIHIGAEDTAYVIFTSGSTGRPRGVPVSHANLTQSTLARLQVYAEAPDRFLLLSSAAFDSSIVGLFWPLATGGTIVLPTDRQAHDPDELLRLFRTESISHTLLVPTLYQALMDRAATDRSATGKQDTQPKAPSNSTPWPLQIIVAGETCRPSLVQQHFAQHPSAKLSNEYGPTEATVWATVHHCRPEDDTIPIGTPIPGSWLSVVDQSGDPRPVGVAGELIVGGSGIVDGYLNDPDSSAARFGAVSYGSFFRTGDRALITDGTVHFLGRLDDQLNLGGNRVEPGDIEQVILKDPTVGAAIVTATDPRQLDELVAACSPVLLAQAMAQASSDHDPATKLRNLLLAQSASRLRLVAHLEPHADTTIDLESVRQRIREGLPPQLRPVIWEVHHRLPRSPNGKLDRRAATNLTLNPSAHRPSVTGPVGPANTRVEEDSGNAAVLSRVSDLMAETLGLDRMETEESFFDLGGHSLLAMELLLELEREFATDISVTSLYDHPTPRLLSKLVGVPDPAPVQNRYLVPIQPLGSKPPIFGIHVLGQNSRFYRPLAKELGPDQPVFGLGLPGLTPDTTGPTDVAGIAECYAQEIVRCSPEGPITLAAVSLGSVVAYELAANLSARGRTIAMLVFFDAAGPSAAELAPSKVDRLGLHWRELQASRATYLKARLTSFQRRSERNVERLNLWGRSQLRLDLSNGLRVRRFIEDNWASQSAYHFAPCQIPILVFQAEEDQFLPTLAEHGMGWTDVAQAGVTVVPVPGGHLSMLAPPHVGVLADQLSQAQSQALEVLPLRPEQDDTASDPIGSFDEVSQTLGAALQLGRLGLEVDRWRSSDPPPSPEALKLLDDCENTLRSIADQAQAAGNGAVRCLAEVGIEARLTTIPSYLQHCSLQVTLVLGQQLSASEVGQRVTRAVSELVFLGYEKQDPMSAGAWQSYLRSNSSCTLIRANESTTRLKLIWGKPTTESRLQAITSPNRSDLAAIDLPGWAWPLYRGVRPLRILDDKRRGRQAGGDLGVFLGTPTGMIEHILSVASPTETDVMVDVGCGDGRVLIEAVRTFGCRARGIETSLNLVETASAAVTAAGLSNQIQITHADAADVDLSGATLIFLFLPPEVAAHLLPSLFEQLPAGGRILAHEQLQAEWPIEPDHRQLIVEKGFTMAYLWEKAMEAGQ